MLPSVLSWNSSVNADRQAIISETLDQPSKAASGVVGNLIASLGMPTRLRDVDVRRDQFQKIAEASMHDRWIKTNPRKIDGPDQIVEILEMAW
tara:strand:- start:622 stop:900 length:279 start_codon:yes stop_codon:yes gene_type:complete